MQYATTPRDCLEIYLEQSVPTTRAKRHSIGTDTQAADSVLVTGQNTDPLSLQHVPNIAIVIVVSSEKQSARRGESYRGDAA